MKKLLITTCVGLVLSSGAALADEKDDRIAMLEQQLQMLAAEVQALKEERVAEKQEMAEIKAKAEQAVSLAASIEPSAGQVSDDAVSAVQTEVDVRMSPSPKFVYGDMSFQPFGRVHLDYAVFDDDAADHPNGAEFRRARLGMKGKVAKDLGYKVEVDFANDDVALKDVYMNYTGIEDTDIVLGHHKPAFGLEEMTSSNYITFVERSAPTAAFVTGHQLGISASHDGGNWSLTGGAFNDGAGRSSSDDEAWALAARGTFAPVADDDRTIHLGAAVMHRRPDQANDSFDFDSRAENAVQSSDSVSANFGNAESANIYGLETAVVYGALSAQGEYIMADVDRSSTNSDLDFGGGYAQLAWTVTGERRPYDAGSGTFGRIAPDNPFDPANGQWGALELAARYSTIDVTDGNVLGGEMDNYTLGANWYLHKHVRLMANYINVDTDNNAVTADDDPQILLFRGQVDF